MPAAEREELAAMTDQYAAFEVLAKERPTCDDT